MISPATRMAKPMKAAQPGSRLTACTSPAGDAVFRL